MSHSSGEGPPAEDGHIEPTKAIEDVRPDPYPLPKEFEWSVLDVNDSNQVCQPSKRLRFTHSRYR